ncbi:HBS1-like protein [Xenia sp. Carnegie-2017]|uniref:HBS1-like protein n=1 Tax=Xenia sp. Carnegie-2017 TaxID=2897299 RepID=UPI001F0435AE|nr:HBS1-like protein [Xenia sp. Carnegie-2017]
MSRHRNVRNYAYEEEMYDDVYGHSVEEHDLCVSPTTAQQFLYRRGESRQADLSSFMEESLDYDDVDYGDNPDYLEDQRDYEVAKLNKEDEVKLLSCLDEFRSILGDHCDENEAKSAIIKHNFDLERAIDDVLNNENQVLRSPTVSRSDKDSRHQNSSAKKDKCRMENASLKVNTPSPTVSTKNSTEARCTSAVEETRIPSPVSPSSTKSAKVNSQKEKEVAKREKKVRQGKTLLNLVVIGHVDAGKSTLMGHVLYLLGDVSKKTMHKYEQDAKKAGKASFAYAWVLDETGEERERGITMDVGLTRIETDSKIITLMDAPGHKDFIPNMISGAAQADVAVLVVASSTGEFEAGFEAGGQTREHAILIRSLGVTQLLVAVNKLDTVGWSQERYNTIITKLKKFLKQVGFKESDVNYVPCSGLTGENLVKPAQEKSLISWYKGPSIIQGIDSFNVPERPLDKPFRLCVSDVFKGTGSGVNIMGRAECGQVKNGQKVMVMPAAVQGQAKSISVHGEPGEWAQAGDHVTLTVHGVDIVNITVGSILCDPSNPIQSVTKLRARIMVFNIDVPLTRGFPVVFHFQTINEPAIIKRLISVLHKNTGEIIQKKPRCLTKNSTANIELELSRPVCVELYKDCRNLGRFMLRYGGKTIAAGIVTKI